MSEMAPMFINDEQRYDWLHRQIVDLMDDTAFETRTTMYDRLHQMAQVTGAFAHRPTDLSAHVGCDLAVVITLRQDFPEGCAAAPAEPNAVLMAHPGDFQSEHIELVSVWCNDHERFLDHGRTTKVQWP